MKVTARQALAAFREMNIAEADETGGKMKNEKGKERDSGSRRQAGHLVVPVWNTKRVSTANCLLPDSSCASL